MEDVRMCKKCNKVMKLIICKTNPAATEWYCEDCHYSEYASDKPGTPARRTDGRK